MLNLGFTVISSIKLIELVAVGAIKPKPAESIGCGMSNGDIFWGPKEGSDPVFLPFRGQKPAVLRGAGVMTEGLGED